MPFLAPYKICFHLSDGSNVEGKKLIQNVIEVSYLSCRLNVHRNMKCQENRLHCMWKQRYWGIIWIMPYDIFKDTSHKLKYKYTRIVLLEWIYHLWDTVFIYDHTENNMNN